MVVRIRLKKVGRKGLPSYRIVVTDVRNQRDGKYIEQLGFYDPRNNIENIDLKRVDYWVLCGAQPSDTVKDIIRHMRSAQQNELDK